MSLRWSFHAGSSHRGVTRDQYVSARSTPCCPGHRSHTPIAHCSQRLTTVASSLQMSHPSAVAIGCVRTWFPLMGHRNFFVFFVGTCFCSSLLLLMSACGSASLPPGATLAWPVFVEGFLLLGLLPLLAPRSCPRARERFAAGLGCGRFAAGLGFLLLGEHERCSAGPVLELSRRRLVHNSSIVTCRGIAIAVSNNCITCCSVGAQENEKVTAPFKMRAYLGSVTCQQ